jgi:hypothetical protein
MRGVCLGFASLVVLLCFASSAEAATCGATKSSAKEPIFGTLTLKANESEPNVNAGRKTGERRMLFVFEVSECNLRPSEDIHARVLSSDLDPDTFGAPEIEADKSLLLVTIPVVTEKFDPGKHSAIATVGGSNIFPSVTKVSLQRSENRWLIPAGICLFAALLALAALVARAYFEAKDPDDPDFHVGYLFSALFGAVVGAALVYKSTYLEPEIWESDFGHCALLFFAAAAAAGGTSVLTAVNKVWTKAT